MSHLSLETIARLVEEAPDTVEAAHLASCAQCRTELAAMNEDVHALSMLPDVAAAPDRWDALERRLSDEGLIRRPVRGFDGGRRRMMQIAAALTLFLGGTIAGRMTAAPAVDTTAAAPTIDASPAVQRSPGPRAATATEDAQREPAADAGLERTPTRSVPPVTLVAGAPEEPLTMDDAAELVRRAEDTYLSALTQYAELAMQSDAGDPVARLAALQSIILTTQAALSQTPTDPVINGYHLTALAQRNATLRQVAAASSERWY